MTTREAAAALGVGEHRVRVLCARGQIVASRRGRDWWIEVDDYGRPITRRWARGRPGRPRKGGQR